MLCFGVGLKNHRNTQGQHLVSILYVLHLSLIQALNVVETRLQARSPASKHAI